MKLFMDKHKTPTPQVWYNFVRVRAHLSNGGWGLLTMVEYTGDQTACNSSVNL